MTGGAPGDGARSDEVRLAVALSPAEVERIARRAAELVETRATRVDVGRPYLSVREAADYLRCSRQRVYDLLSQGALTRLKDGTRVLVARAEVDAYSRACRRDAPRGGSEGAETGRRRVFQNSLFSVMFPVCSHLGNCGPLEGPAMQETIPC